MGGGRPVGQTRGQKRRVDKGKISEAPRNPVEKEERQGFQRGEGTGGSKKTHSQKALVGSAVVGDSAAERLDREASWAGEEGKSNSERGGSKPAS